MIIIHIDIYFWDETWCVCFVSLPVGTMTASRDVVCVFTTRWVSFSPTMVAPVLLREPGTGKMIALMQFIDDIYSRVYYVHGIVHHM